MEIFRENAQVLKNAVAKRRMAATLVRKEPRSQVRIFNTIFTIEGSSDEEDNETKKKKKEKEKILESVIQARIEQKEAEERQKETEEIEIKETDNKRERDPFEYLSPISESEDDCEVKRGQARRQVVVCHVVEEEVKEVQPWIVAVPLPVGDDKPEVRTREVQTDFILATKQDGDCNTDMVEKEDVVAQCSFFGEEGAPSTNPPGSAFTTILEILTEEIYLDQLIAWKTGDYSSKQTIKVVSETLCSPKFINFFFNEKRNSFVVLSQAGSRLALEQWTLKNLIKPQIFLFPDFSSVPKILLLTSTSDNFAIIVDSSLFLFSIENLTLLSTTDIFLDGNPLEITAFSFDGTWITVADSGGFFIYRIKEHRNLEITKQFQTSKLIKQDVDSVLLANELLFVLAESALSVYNSISGLHLNSVQLGKTEKKKGSKKQGQVIELNFDERKILAFSRTIGKAVIVEKTKFIEFGETDQEFTFSPPDIPIQFSSSSAHLFSIDAEGTVSQWQLLSNHRKMRTRIFKTNIPDPLSFDAHGDNRFSILTSEELYFLILPE